MLYQKSKNFILFTIKLIVSVCSFKTLRVILRPGCGLVCLFSGVYCVSKGGLGKVFHYTGAADTTPVNL